MCSGKKAGSMVLFFELLHQRRKNCLLYGAPKVRRRLRNSSNKGTSLIANLQTGQDPEPVQTNSRSLDEIRYWNGGGTNFRSPCIVSTQYYTHGDDLIVHTNRSRGINLFFICRRRSSLRGLKEQQARKYGIRL